MSNLERLVKNSLGIKYTPKVSSYSILSPEKATERLANGGWTEEASLVRRHANGNDEHLVILSRPHPKPQPPVRTPNPTVVDRVKETIRGSRKP